MLSEMEGGFLLSRGLPGPILSDDGLGTPPLPPVGTREPHLSHMQLPVKGRKG